jgi:hypothetical protein
MVLADQLARAATSLDASGGGAPAGTSANKDDDAGDDDDDDVHASAVVSTSVSSRGGGAFEASIGRLLLAGEIARARALCHHFARDVRWGPGCALLRAHTVQRTVMTWDLLRLRDATLTSACSASSCVLRCRRYDEHCARGRRVIAMCAECDGRDRATQRARRCVAPDGRRRRRQERAPHAQR